MEQKSQTFHIRGITYSEKELVRLCYSSINDASVKEWEKECFQFIFEWFSPGLEIIVQTSGSTGKPKKISLKKKYMMASALATLNFFDLKPKDTAVLCLPVKYIAGKMMIVRALVGGLDLYLVEPTSAPAIDFPKKVQFCAMVANQVFTLLQSDNGIKSLNSIKQLIIGGSFVPKKLEQAIQVIETAVWQTYGMTETITHIALRKINQAETDEYYSPLPGVQVHLSDDGCLVINAEQIGIKNLLTNDLAEVDQNGKFKIFGRADHVIISGGIKLFPEKIEEKLGSWIENAFYISSLPDDTLGSKLILYIEDKGRLKMQIYQLWEKVESLLSEYEIPKEIIFCEKFSLTGSGKIIRN